MLASNQWAKPKAGILLSLILSGSSELNVAAQIKTGYLFNWNSIKKRRLNNCYSLLLVMHGNRWATAKVRVC